MIIDDHMSEVGLKLSPADKFILPWIETGSSVINDTAMNNQAQQIGSIFGGQFEGELPFEDFNYESNNHNMLFDQSVY